LMPEDSPFLEQQQIGIPQWRIDKAIIEDEPLVCVKCRRKFPFGSGHLLHLRHDIECGGDLVFCDDADFEIIKPKQLPDEDTR
jgi:hypothetical protein